MRYLARRAWIEIAYVAGRVGYRIKPFDMLADRRRWFWQRRQRCGFSYGIGLPARDHTTP